MHGARDALRPAQSGAWHCGSESEYAAFRVMSGLARLPSVADVELNGRTVVIAEDAHDAALGRTAAPRREAAEDARRLMPFAIGSAVLSTVVLGVAMFTYARRGGVSAQLPTTWSSEPSRSAVSEEGSQSLGKPLPEPVSPPVPPAVTQPPTPPDTEEKPSSAVVEGAAVAGQTASASPTPADPPAPPDSQNPHPGAQEASGSTTRDSSVSGPSPGLQAPLTEKKFDDPRTLAILLKELRDVPMPRRDPKLVKSIFDERVDAAMKRWITITFEASLLDSNLKRMASGEDAWKNRDRGSWRTDGTKDVISLKSGFMMSVNKVRELPANVEWQDEWLEFAKELQGRLEEVRDLVEKEIHFSKAIGEYESALEEDGLLRRFKDLLGSDVHTAWKATTGTLFDRNSLDDEISAVERSLKQHAAESEVTP
jgi:hypothetical protein